MTTRIKKHLLMLPLCATMMISCTENYNSEEFNAEETEMSTEDFYLTRTFAEPDNSKVLNGTPNENLKDIFTATGPDIIRTLGNVAITEEQYQEIKEFTDKLVANCSSEANKYKTIYEWVKKNIKYNNQNNNPQNKYYGNDAYDVFINRICICQGYANLQVVMCHTQGIPAVVVNGFANTGYRDEGHAWTYTCPDNLWYVSDPTWGYDWVMKYPSQYNHLRPQQTDAEIFKDDVAIYNYYGYSINIKEVTAAINPFIVPYSVGGFVISSFNPLKPLPKEITDICVGENIKTFGESDNIIGLNDHAPHLQAIHIDENNPMLMSHKGIAYKRNGDESQLYYIPAGMTHIELLPIEKVEKNTIYRHNNVKEIYFPEGTKYIESFAIENCPKLERVYVPTDATVDKNAIWDCPRNVEIIYGAPSSVGHITLD